MGPLEKAKTNQSTNRVFLPASAYLSVSVPLVVFIKHHFTPTIISRWFILKGTGPALKGQQKKPCEQGVGDSGEEELPF